MEDMEVLRISFEMNQFGNHADRGSESGDLVLSNTPIQVDFDHLKEAIPML